MLIIDAYAGNITIIADQTDKIIIEATKQAVTKKSLDNLEPFIRVRNHEAQIVTRFKEDSWFNGSISAYIDYVIRVPKSINLPRINAGSGSIYLQGIRRLMDIRSRKWKCYLKKCKWWYNG